MLTLSGAPDVSWSEFSLRIKSQETKQDRHTIFSSFLQDLSF